MTLTTYADVCAALVAEFAEISALKSVPSAPPEQAADFPFLVVIMGSGKAKGNTPEDIRLLGDIDAELHVARKDLPLDVVAAVALLEPVANAFFAALRDDTTPHGDVTWTQLMQMSWGDVQTVGFRFTVHEVKILQAVT